MSHRKFAIAVLPGDGIGVDVTREALRVVRSIEARLPHVEFELREYSAGAREYQKSGRALPDDVYDACLDCDAVLLGAMGLPQVRWPDGRELTPQIDLRERLGLYAGIRPVKLYATGHSPLKGRKAGDIDFVIVRESTEGLFSSRHEPSHPETGEVHDRLRITRAGSERVFHAAFRLARTRRKHVTLVDKANVLPSMVFLRSIFDEIAGQYPEVETSRLYVDAAALLLVQRPERFDVVVTENMFGDILSDLSAALVGGMGMAPSADIGEGRAVFQPAHGTAPDLAGQGIANPTAAILSVAMMLEWLEHPETQRGAALIRQGVEQTFCRPHQGTPDLGGSLGTAAMTDAILASIAGLPAD